MAKKKLPKPANPNRTAADQVKFLKTLLFYTERAITGKGGSVDDFFIAQAESINKEIEELKTK